MRAAAPLITANWLRKKSSKSHTGSYSIRAKSPIPLRLLLIRAGHLHMGEAKDHRKHGDHQAVEPCDDLAFGGQTLDEIVRVVSVEGMRRGYNQQRSSQTEGYSDRDARSHVAGEHSDDPDREVAR